MHGCIQSYGTYVIKRTSVILLECYLISFFMQYSDNIKKLYVLQVEII